MVIQPRAGIFRGDLRGVWEWRELLYFFVWRDTKVRYKQTLVGVVWVVIQPLLTTIVFTVVFGHFARFSSDGIPYAVFTYAAVLPWTYFASALSRSSVSLVSSSNLLTKVYFPRLVIPIAAALTPLIDCVPATAVLLGVDAALRCHARVEPARTASSAADGAGDCAGGRLLAGTCQREVPRRGARASVLEFRCGCMHHRLPTR